MSEFRSNIKTYKDLRVHSVSYQLALDVFHLTKIFPKEETYSMTDQIRRSSRSVSANIREGFAKRKYPNVFLRHLTDAIGSSEETREWLDFASDFGYIQKPIHDQLDKKYDEVNAMLYKLIENWIKF